MLEKVNNISTHVWEKYRMSRLRCIQINCGEFREHLKICNANFTAKQASMPAAGTRELADTPPTEGKMFAMVSWICSIHRTPDTEIDVQQGGAIAIFAITGNDDMGSRRDKIKAVWVVIINLLHINCLSLHGVTEQTIMCGAKRR